jgi:hypothetical protein
MIERPNQKSLVNGLYQRFLTDAKKQQKNCDLSLQSPGTGMLVLALTIPLACALALAPLRLAYRLLQAKTDVPVLNQSLALCLALAGGTS